MDCDKTFGDRLKKAREAAGLSQQAVADAVLEPSKDGTHRKNTIYEWEKKKYVPDALALEKLVRLYHVDGHWLVTGEGEMYPGDEVAEVEAFRRMARIADEVRAKAMLEDAERGSLAREWLEALEKIERTDPRPGPRVVGGEGDPE